MPSYFAITKGFNSGDENIYYAALSEAISAVLSMSVSMSGSLQNITTTMGVAVGSVRYVTIASGTVV
jgi:hypothetical protein